MMNILKRLGTSLNAPSFGTYSPKAVSTTNVASVTAKVVDDDMKSAGPTSTASDSGADIGLLNREDTMEPPKRKPSDPDHNVENGKKQRSLSSDMADIMAFTLERPNGHTKQAAKKPLKKVVKRQPQKTPEHGESVAADQIRRDEETDKEKAVMLERQLRRPKNFSHLKLEFRFLVDSTKIKKQLDINDFPVLPRIPTHLKELLSKDIGIIDDSVPGRAPRAGSKTKEYTFPGRAQLHVPFSKLKLPSNKQDQEWQIRNSVGSAIPEGLDSVFLTKNIRYCTYKGIQYQDLDTMLQKMANDMATEFEREFVPAVQRMQREYFEYVRAGRNLEANLLRQVLDQKDVEFPSNNSKPALDYAFLTCDVCEDAVNIERKIRDFIGVDIAKEWVQEIVEQNWFRNE